MMAYILILDYRWTHLTGSWPPYPKPPWEFAGDLQPAEGADEGDQKAFDHMSFVECLG